MPTRRRLVWAAIELATRSGAESTERAGLTSISASHSTSSPHASPFRANSWISRKPALLAAALTQLLGKYPEIH